MLSWVSYFSFFFICICIRTCCFVRTYATPAACKTCFVLFIVLVPNTAHSPAKAVDFFVALLKVHLPFSNFEVLLSYNNLEKRSFIKIVEKSTKGTLHGLKGDNCVDKYRFLQCCSRQSCS